MSFLLFQYASIYLVNKSAFYYILIVYFNMPTTYTPRMAYLNHIIWISVSFVSSVHKKDSQVKFVLQNVFLLNIFSLK